jgi:hypothetical protein
VEVPEPIEKKSIDELKQLLNNFIKHSNSSDVIDKELAFVKMEISFYNYYK